MTSRDVTLRPVRPEDEDFLFRVFTSTRSDEFADAPLTESQIGSLMRMQFRAQTAHFSSHFPAADHSMIMKGDELVGRLYVDRNDERIHIVDIALLPQHRNAGIGSRLIDELFHEADASGQLVRLHVARSNRAVKLYERLGFASIGGNDIYLLMERAPAS